MATWHYAKDLVTLHGAWHSHFAKRVQMALQMKGVKEYAYVEQNVGVKSPEFLVINPKGTVPVLVHKGKTIVESLRIIEYIDDAFPKGDPILPKDAFERSQARSLMNFIDDKAIDPLWKVHWMKGSEESIKAENEAFEALKTLEKQIEGKKFFGGDNIGAVDLTASFIAFGLPLLEELTEIKILKEFKNLSEWAERYSKFASAKAEAGEYFPTYHPLAKKYFPPLGQLRASYKVGIESLPPKDRVVNFYKDAATRF